jgi:hypothetical protein
MWGDQLGTHGTHVGFPLKMSTTAKKRKIGFEGLMKKNKESQLAKKEAKKAHLQEVLANKKRKVAELDSDDSDGGGSDEKEEKFVFEVPEEPQSDQASSDDNTSIPVQDKKPETSPALAKVVAKETKEVVSNQNAQKKKKKNKWRRRSRPQPVACGPAEKKGR